MKTLDRIYWDACMWIAYINIESRFIGSDGKTINRYLRCKNILESARQRKIIICTSAFTLSEVCKLPDGDYSKSENLSSFFDHEYILLINVDKSIGVKAQHLQQSGLSGLKPPDAIHLASAIRANVSKFHTFDNKLLNLNNKLETTLNNKLEICIPEIYDNDSQLEFDLTNSKI